MKKLDEATCDLSHFEFVALAPNEWVGQWMNRQHLFSRIGKVSTVVYSNGVPYYWEFKKTRSLFSRIFTRFVIDSNVIVEKPSSLLVKIKAGSLYSRFVTWLHTRNLISQLPGKGYRVLYIFHPNYSDYIDYIPYDLLVYHPYDNFSKQSKTESQSSDREKRLVTCADIVISTSRLTTSYLSEKYSRENIYTVPNGVDFCKYSEAINQPYHHDIKDIAHPRIGYVGSINKKVDLDLINQLADRFRSVSFVLVGPVGNLGEKKKTFDELSEKANVFLLGNKKYHELPSIVAGLDCHMLCYDTNPKMWAFHSYPLKLNECLATKKPVISCNLPAVEGLSEIADVAFTYDDWENAINQVLAGAYDKCEAGYEYASKQNWDNRIEVIGKMMCDILQNKYKPSE